MAEYAVKVHQPNLGPDAKNRPQDVHVMIPPIYDEEGNEESPYFAFNVANGHTVHVDITPAQADLLRNSYGFEVSSVAGQKAAKARAEEGGE